MMLVRESKTKEKRVSLRRNFNSGQDERRPAVQYVGIDMSCSAHIAIKLDQTSETGNQFAHG